MNWTIFWVTNLVSIPNHNFFWKKLQVYAFPDLIWTTMSSRNWRDFICPFHVNKQLGKHTRVFFGCWFGFCVEHWFRIIWQSSLGHHNSFLVQFHPSCFSVSDTKRSYWFINIDYDHWLNFIRHSRTTIVDSLHM